MDRHQRTLQALLINLERTLWWQHRDLCRYEDRFRIIPQAGFRRISGISRHWRGQS